MDRKSKFHIMLESGELIGYSVNPENPENLRWILLKKELPTKPNFDAIEDEEIKEMLNFRYQNVVQQPYRVSIRELSSAAHHSEEYESQDDYTEFENFRFSTVDEVENFIQNLGLLLDNVDSARNIDAP